MASRIQKNGWLFLYAATGLIDLTQILIDFFPPVGEGINEFADIVIGVGLAAYFQVRGVSLTEYPSRLFSLIGGEAAAEMTGGAAPAWILDVWYIHRTVKKEEAELAAAKEAEEGEEDGPVYREGVRRPSDPNRGAPAYSGGIRLPSNVQPYPSVLAQASSEDEGVEPVTPPGEDEEGTPGVETAPSVSPASAAQKQASESVSATRGY